MTGSKFITLATFPLICLWLYLIESVRLELPNNPTVILKSLGVIKCKDTLVGRGLLGGIA